MNTQTVTTPAADVTTPAAHVFKLAERDYRAFLRLSALEHLHAAAEPALPDLDAIPADQHAAAVNEHTDRVVTFERSHGIAAAGRLADRAARRVEAAGRRLAAVPAASMTELLAKARVADTAGRQREGVDWVRELNASLAADVRALATDAA